MMRNGILATLLKVGCRSTNGEVSWGKKILLFVVGLSTFKAEQMLRSGRCFLFSSEAVMVSGEDRK